MGVPLLFVAWLLTERGAGLLEMRGRVIDVTVEELEHVDDFTVRTSTDASELLGRYVAREISIRCAQRGDDGERDLGGAIVAECHV